MRILMANKFLYPRAGAETYMLELSQALIKEGHQVAFFGMDHPDKTTLGKTYTIKPIDFSIQKNRFSKALQLFNAAIQNLSIRKKFLSCCQEFQPDIIHAHNIYNQLPPSLFKGIQTPVIMTAHDYKAVCPSYNLFSQGQNCTSCLKGSFTSCITKKCVQSSFIASTISALSSWHHKIRKTYHNDIDRYIAPSHFMKKTLMQGGLPSYKIQVIHNFTQSRGPYTKPGKNLLYAGRICQEKGVDTLIEAYERLPQPRPLLRICGTGPLKPQLETYTKEKKLNIQWLGYVNPKQIEKEMNAAAMVIVPSLWNENCSMTIMESLASGRPVIASKSGGNQELINPGYNGFTFDAGDASQLTNRIGLLLKSNLNEFSRNAAQSGTNFFSTNCHLKHIIKTYRQFQEEGSLVDHRISRREPIQKLPSTQEI